MKDIGVGFISRRSARRWRFEPLLIVTKEQIDKAVDAIDAVVSRSVVSLALSFERSSASRALKG
jgi:acetylornithine/succinyldiaminopimelate/putrescine aminotransferase